MTPQTDLKLLQVPLSIDNENQLTFNNFQEQFNYFNNLPNVLIEDITYQRENSAIRYPGYIDDLIHYNYCMYKNKNKQYYAYITGLQYINDSMTLIFIKTDVFQTYQFEIQYKDCFIEREHVNSDRMGEHTVPENIYVGEYITNDTQIDNTLQEFSIILASTTSPIDGKEQTGLFNNVPSGVGYYGYNLDEIDILQENLQYLTDQGKQSGITGIFIIPSAMINYVHNGQFIGNTVEPHRHEITLHAITSLDGYTPVNKKLFTSSYCFIEVYNGNGGTLTLKPELWNGPTTLSFEVYGTVCPGGSIIGFPSGYDGINSRNQLYGLVGGKYPQLNYATDLYTNWQTENGLNIMSGLLESGISSIGAITTRNLSGAIQAGTQIANVLYSDKLADRIPPQVQGNINCGDVNYSLYDTTFLFFYKTIKKEYAQIADKYLSMYGYKVATVKTPNITGRENWNYIKTIGCNIEANIPQNDIEEIKSLFNNGITLWHNPNTFLNYNQSNNIV